MINHSEIEDLVSTETVDKLLKRKDEFSSVGQDKNMFY